MTAQKTSQSLTDPMDDSLDYQLRRASLGALQYLMQSCGELGLKVADAAIIRVIAANPGSNQGGIAKLLGMQRANIVPLITALVDSGLVRREPVDGRTNALYLTEDGEAARAKIQTLAKEHEERFFGDMPEDMRTTLMEAARRIRARVDGANVDEK